MSVESVDVAFASLIFSDKLDRTCSLQQEMRKYLFIAANEWCRWGGSEFLWGSAAEKLARRGNEVCVSARYRSEPVREIEQLRLMGCRIFYRRPPSFIFRQARKVFPLPGDVSRYVREAGRGVDLVVISQGANGEGLPWMEEARAAGYNYVVIAHSAVAYWWPDDDVAERLAECYEKAQVAYFVSQATLDLTRRQFTSPLRNAKVIRNPFNVRYEAQPPWPQDFSDGLSLACVARLDVISKAQDLLLEVLSLPHWRKRKVRVSLVGNGVNERGLRRLVGQLELTSVEFAGYSNDIEEIWGKHHALVLPSRFEGMPITLIEAMLCGRPCIATDVGGIRELLRDGVNGFLAKAPTVELLDEAMNCAWECRDRLREMGERAARDVRQWVSSDPAEDFVQELERLTK
jgi:glycosyltransferase involved in cell wall biosynthesis